MMSLVKRGQTSTRINSASGIQSHTTVRWWCNWGHTLRKPRKSRCAREVNPAGQLHSGIRPTPWPATPRSRVKRKKAKQAHRLNTEIVFLPQNSCRRVRVSCRRRNSGYLWTVDLELHSTWPRVYNPGKKTRSETEGNWGLNHSQGRFDAFRFLHNTCCLATVLVRLTSKYKKAMRWISEMDWRRESYVTDTLHWKNLLLKWREKTHPSSSSRPPHLPISPFTWSSRLAISSIHFYFNHIFHILHLDAVNLYLEW